MRLALLCLAFLGLWPSQLVAQQDDHALKAVWLYKFAFFVNWPDSAFERDDEPLVIGVLDGDQFGDLVEIAVTGERVGERGLEVVRFAEVRDLRLADDAGQAAATGLPCHILFVGKGHENLLPELFATLQGRSILTVGESGNFLDAGGIIKLARNRRRLGIEINNVRARCVDLKISSRLLRVSTIFDGLDACD